LFINNKQGMKMEIFVPEDVLEEAQEVAGNLLSAVA
jgi:hypothetical protein